MDNVIESKGRADMYRFLASIYLMPPGEGVVNILRNEDATGAFAFVSDRTKTLLEEAAGEDVSEDALSQEFHNLFVVPMGQYTTPFEAVYRDEREVAGKKVRGLLMGPSTMDVAERYRRAGAEKLSKELPDHIGCELAFMEYLCAGEALSRENGDDAGASFFRNEGRRFLEDHLTQWAGAFAGKVCKKAKLSWYKAMSNATLDYLEYDLKSLSDRAVN